MKTEKVGRLCFLVEHQQRRRRWRRLAVDRRDVNEAVDDVEEFSVVSKDRLDL